MITVFVVDDENPALRTMKSYIDRTPGMTCLGYESDPIKAKLWFETNMHSLPDIVFLDIQMKKLKGLVLAELLKGKTRIVFTTAYPEFAMVSFDYDIVDYLLKPFDYERFCQAVEKCALVNLPTFTSKDEQEGYLIVKDSGNKINKLKITSISHIDAAGNYIKVFMDDNTSLMPILTLKRAGELLNSFGFLQIHRSHIVNLHKVKSYRFNILELENKTKFAISRNFKNVVLSGLEKINSTILKLK